MKIIKKRLLVFLFGLLLMFTTKIVFAQTETSGIGMIITVPICTEASVTSKVDLKEGGVLQIRALSQYSSQGNNFSKIYGVKKTIFCGSLNLSTTDRDKTGKIVLRFIPSGNWLTENKIEGISFFETINNQTQKIKIQAKNGFYEATFDKLPGEIIILGKGTPNINLFNNLRELALNELAKRENISSAKDAIIVSGLAVPTFSLMLFSGTPYNLFLILKEIFFRTIGLFGWRKRKRGWGMVYDIRTGKPLPLANVQIFNEEKNKLVGSTVTDKFGAYFFLVPAGKYTLNSIKNGFSVFSKKGVSLPLAFYENSYDYKTLSFSQDTKIEKNLPMWQERHIVIPPKKAIFKRIVSFLGRVIFWAGFVLNIFMFILNPSLLNFFLLIVYAYLALASFFYLGEEKWGTIKDASGKPMPFTTVELLDKKSGRLVGRSITDVHGRYYLIANRGAYELKVITNGDPVISFSQDLFCKRRGGIGVNLVMKKQ